MMPLYYFDTIDGGPPVRDNVGMELEDDEAARRRGTSILPDMARQELPDGNMRCFTVIIRDVTKRPIFIADLTLAGRWLL